MSCGCNAGPVISWYDLQNTAPKSPFDLIANAYIGGNQGEFAYSTTFVDPPGGVWTPSPITYLQEATCIALESDNQLMVADANQWNFRHQTVNLASDLAPPLQKVIYLRGGRQWQMDIFLDLGTTATDLQLSFLDNAGTRGDYAGTIPVINFAGPIASPAKLSITLKDFGKVSMGLRMIDSVTGDWSMYEMDWVIVP